ncbi:hypothetical protein E3J62_07030 [candidate division TA06 bacterium]|uniref:Uncharacterized protein n=1 Tax=candidate division TA06 bacterium TaxID=2250710 RepID=A0A523USQ0_UNCT6|nr:MAG: hypothetical protein E3J62_07030 [candidate division TA06 bacterium]
MKSVDEKRLSRNERKISEWLELSSVSELPEFPFSSLEEIKCAKQSGDISFAAVYRWNLIGVLGTRADTIISYLGSLVPLLISITFIVVSFIASNLYYLVGTLSTAFGLALTSSYIRGCVYTLLGLCWIPGIYFAFRNPALSWVIGGFYAGYISGGMIRWRFGRLVETRALQSEVFFCYLYLNKVLIIKDNKTGMLI